MNPAASWSDEKNKILKQRYGFGFERIVAALQAGKLVEDIQHPNQTDYSHQRMLIVEIDGYGYGVPYVENDTEVFFKTFFPSRQLTKKYLYD